jgi:hypothetical protein
MGHHQGGLQGAEVPGQRDQRSRIEAGLAETARADAQAAMAAEGATVGGKDGGDDVLVRGAVEEVA